MSEIRKLTLEEWKEIYRTHIREDFPLMEQRPWFAVEHVWDRGGYAAYGYYEDERFLAYASFYPCKESDCILMDYFAVAPELRGQGIGSAFLRDLLPAAGSGGTIIGEVESVSSAKDEEERNIRQRRIDFYQNCGAVLCGVSCHLFGVDYSILCFPKEGEERTQDEYYDTVCAMYRELYRPVYGRICRPYRDGEEE